MNYSTAMCLAVLLSHNRLAVPSHLAKAIYAGVTGGGEEDFNESSPPTEIECSDGLGYLSFVVSGSNTPAWYSIVLG
jgi:hypothetical protein